MSFIADSPGKWSATPDPQPQPVQATAGARIWVLKVWERDEATEVSVFASFAQAKLLAQGIIGEYADDHDLDDDDREALLDAIENWTPKHGGSVDYNDSDNELILEPQTLRP